MPIYEYECDEGHKHQRRRPMSQCKENAICPDCGQEAKRIISVTFWHMGWNFLKGKALDSEPAPEDPGYHPEWDQAYQGPQAYPKASVPK